MNKPQKTTTTLLPPLAFNIRLFICAMVLLSSLLLTPKVKAQDLKGDASKGASKVSLCAGCHSIPGYRASTPEVYSVPMIGGQSSGYIAAALYAYKKGERKHPTMGGIAGSLSAQDIADLSEYYAAQNAATMNNTLK